MTENQIEFLQFQINEIDSASIKSANEDEELNNELEVLENAEKLKELTRGHAVNKETMLKFVDSLEIPEEAKARLRELTPATYIGRAKTFAKDI